MVYLIVCEENGTCKIGYTYENPKSRLGSLRCASPYDIELKYLLDGDQAEEKRLHEQFNHLRLQREWFTLTDEILEYFAARNVEYVRPPKKKLPSDNYCLVELNPNEYKKYNQEELQSMAALGRLIYDMPQECVQSTLEYISIIKEPFGTFGNELRLLVKSMCKNKEQVDRMHQHYAELLEFIDSDDIHAMNDDTSIDLIQHTMNNDTFID